MQVEHLRALNAARRQRRPAILITDIGTGAARFFGGGDDWTGHPLADHLDARLRSGRSGMVTDDAGNQWFLTVQVPDPRLIVVGAVHISQAIAPIASLAGFALTIVDPRTAFATPDRFPGVDLVPRWPEDVLPGLDLDPYTAFAALTHDPKIDDWAIAHALERRCFYVGALGSRKTHARRLERLPALGVGPEAAARIDAPIGADIGAASPAEIAVAILANVIAALRKPGAGVERARKGASS